MSVPVAMKTRINDLYLAMILVLQIIYFCFQIFFHDFSTSNETNGSVFGGWDVSLCVGDKKRRLVVYMQNANSLGI